MEYYKIETILNLDDIESPQQGLVIYNTELELYQIYDEDMWKILENKKRCLLLHNVNEGDMLVYADDKKESLLKASPGKKIVYIAKEPLRCGDYILV